MSSITALTSKSLNSNCCYVHRSKMQDLLLYTLLVDVRFGLQQLLVISFVDQFTTNSLWFILPASKPPQGGALISFSCKQKKGRLNVRSDRLHEISYVLISPQRGHLISMLKRMARSLLVQRCLYAVWLERNNNTIPIRGRCNSPIPVQHLLVAPDRTGFARFNQL